jgi:hypothetical protein
MQAPLNTLLRLQQWYVRQCNGEWEHDCGISIESCDNPGWWVKIQLKGTVLQDRGFRTVEENVDEHGFQISDSWLCCRMQGSEWHGAGDETRLEQILVLFLDWAESNGG